MGFWLGQEPPVLIDRKGCPGRGLCFACRSLFRFRQGAGARLFAALIRRGSVGEKLLKNERKLLSWALGARE